MGVTGALPLVRGRGRWRQIVSRCARYVGMSNGCGYVSYRRTVGMRCRVGETQLPILVRTRADTGI